MPAHISAFLLAAALFSSEGGGEPSCRQFEEGLYLRATLSDKGGVAGYIDSLRSCGNDSPDVLLSLGRFLCNKRDYAKAGEVLERLTTDEAVDMKVRAEALYYRAQCAMAEERYGEAVSWLSESAKNGFDPVWCYNSIAVALLDANQPGDALRAAEKSLSHAPNYAPALSNKGRALELLGRREEAIRFFQRADAAAGGGEPRYRSRTTRAWVAALQQDSARISAELGLRAFPSDRQIIYDRANVANEDRDYALGRRLARRLLELGPRTAQDWFDVAYVYNDAGRMDSAFYYYSVGLRLNPWSGQANHNIGIIYKRMGMFEEAHAHYDKALAVNTTDRYTLNSKVQAYLWQHQYEDAYHWAQEYSKHYYGDVHSLLGTGYVLMQLKRWDEAVTWLEAWLDKSPRDDRAVNNLARCHAKRGDAELAMGLFARALALNPENAYTYHNRASLLTDLGRFDEACADLKRAIELEYTWLIDSNVLAMRAAHCPEVPVDRRILIREYRGNAIELSDQSFIELVDPLRTAAEETLPLPKVVEEQLVFDPESSNAQSAFRVMPNPSSGPITVERVAWGEEELAVRVFDGSARLLEHRRFGADRLDLDLSRHGAGTYVIMVVSDAAVLSTQRVVIAD